jgi:hypothetical protein
MITNGYIEIDDFKAYAIPEATADTADDATIESIIEAASRFLDGQTGRRFWKNTVDETRYYTAEFFDKVFTDDIVSITALATDESDSRTYSDNWTTADYDLLPYNAALHGIPYTSIEIRNGGSFFFPLYRKAIRITGVFGYPAVPDDIKNACADVAKSIYQRRFGQNANAASVITGAGVVVTPRDVTDTAKFAIQKYRRRV